MPEIKTALLRLEGGETHTADEDGAYVISGANTHADILRFVAADIGEADAIAILLEEMGKTDG